MLCESNNESSENQRSMCDWAEQTFGAVSDPASLVDRALLEMQELGEAV